MNEARSFKQVEKELVELYGERMTQQDKLLWLDVKIKELQKELDSLRHQQMEY